MEINLVNKTAWVFGASRGIGRAVAIELAQSGANILLLARNSRFLEQTKNLLCTKKNQEHDILCVDMSKPEQLLSSIKNYHNKSSVDIIINNSGGPPGGMAHVSGPAEYSDAFCQHVLSAQTIAQVAVPEMKKRRCGRIINIISTSVKQPISGLGVSNTIRGAMANWSKTMASELGPFGITVNNILPGATETERLSSLIKNKAIKHDSSIELVTQKMKEDIPVGRFAQPSEIAYAVAFLCSNQAEYINGVNLPVDGGRTKSL
jgi:3-oxoacyl-[acyl-carrier protein] reductase